MKQIKDVFQYQKISLETKQNCSSAFTKVNNIARVVFKKFLQFKARHSNHSKTEDTCPKQTSNLETIQCHSNHLVVGGGTNFETLENVQTHYECNQITRLDDTHLKWQLSKTCKDHRRATRKWFGIVAHNKTDKVVVKLISGHVREQISCADIVWGLSLTSRCRRTGLNRMIRPVT